MFWPRVFARSCGQEIRPRYEASRSADIWHSLADISRASSFGYFQDCNLELESEDDLIETIRWYRGQEI
jgi:hypothetical protein